MTVLFPNLEPMPFLLPQGDLGNRSLRDEKLDLEWAFFLESSGALG